MNFLLKLIGPVVTVVVDKLDDVLKGLIRDGVRKWHAYALTTNSPLDDWGTRLLAGLFDVDVNNVEPDGEAGANYNPVEGIDFDPLEAEQ